MICPSFVGAKPNPTGVRTMSQADCLGLLLDLLERLLVLLAELFFDDLLQRAIFLALKRGSKASCSSGTKPDMRVAKLFAHAARQLDSIGRALIAKLSDIAPVDRRRTLGRQLVQASDARGAGAPSPGRP